MRGRKVRASFGASYRGASAPQAAARVSSADVGPSEPAEYSCIGGMPEPQAAKIGSTIRQDSSASSLRTDSDESPAMTPSSRRAYAGRVSGAASLTNVEGRKVKKS